MGNPTSEQRIMDGPRAKFREAQAALTRFQWTMREKLRRYRLAWRFAAGTMTRDDAHWLSYHADCAAECWPLVSIETDSVLELAEDKWGKHPELSRLASDATRRVWNKWNSNGDEQNAACDWAMDLIEEYAEADGIVLTEREE